MLPATWADIAVAVQGRLEDVPDRYRWTGRVQIDSRAVQPGDLFLALPGMNHDGHEFAAEAASRGAALIIARADRSVDCRGAKLLVADTAAALQSLSAWHRRRMDALIIAVTGSVGKTTTREMIHQVLQGQYVGTRSRSNFNNEIGLPLSLLEIEPHHEFAVLELGAARIGDIADLAALAAPEIGVITAIGEAHLGTFGSAAAIMQGKGELLEALPRNGFAVLPGDCARLRAMASRAKCRVLFVGEGVENTLHATGIHQRESCLAFQVDGQSYRLPIMGRHHLTNALCAIAIGKEIGMASAVMAECLAEFQPVAGRSHLSRIGPWTVMDDTYNASPLAFAAALKTLCDLPHGRRIVIAGDMLELGSAAQDEHRRLGAQIGRLNVERLLVTGNHADDVAFGAVTAGLVSQRIAAAKEWDTLLFLLECWLEPGDTILVKGSRGMRMERIIDWMKSAAQEAEQTLRKSA